ncbi:MAG: amino acid permease [Lactococcus sp.]
MDSKKLSKFSFFSMTASLFITVYEYPTFADSGKSLIFFLIVCGLLWFLPVALCSAEMASIDGYDKGGIYSWVGDNLGDKFGFTAIFFQWFQVTVGFVTMIYFIIGTLSTVLNVPELNNNALLKFSCVVVIFWVITLLQFRGTGLTSQLAKYGFSLGIIAPVLIMFGFFIKYLLSGQPVSTNFTKPSFVPNGNSLAALTSFVLAYMGVEASAPHINDLENSKKNYPLIMLVLVVVGMALSTIGGSIVSVVLQGKINSDTGVVDALRVLISSGHNSFLVILLSFLVSFGVIAQVASWIVSPTEGLQYVATKGLLPQKYAKKNKFGVPTNLLILQGIVVTFWAAVLTFGSRKSGGNVSFETAISLTVLIYLSAYVLFFISYFVIIYRKKGLKRSYNVPGGLAGKTIVAAFGLLISVAAIVTAFIIPDSLSKSAGHTYIMLLIVSFIVTLIIPLAFYKFYGEKHKIVEE